jgi:hypothetical protein
MGQKVMFCKLQNIMKSVIHMKCWGWKHLTSWTTNKWATASCNPTITRMRNSMRQLYVSYNFGNPDFDAYIHVKPGGPPTCELPTCDHQPSGQSPYKVRPAGSFPFHLQCNHIQRNTLICNAFPFTCKNTNPPECKQNKLSHHVSTERSPWVCGTWLRHYERYKPEDRGLESRLCYRIF